MAFDEALADRIRDVLASRAEVSERKMFGGIAFMLAGDMAVGVIGEDLMVPGGEFEGLSPYSHPCGKNATHHGRLSLISPRGSMVR